MYTPFNDKFILDSLKNNNVRVFKQLFDLYYEGLVRYALRLINEPEIAEEIVLDIFESIWQRRKMILITESLSSYLHASVRYRCISYSKTRIQRLSHENGINNLNQAEVITPYDELVFKDLEDALLNSIQTLPEQCRIIFSLSRNSGLSNTEIAEKLDLTLKTVENQITIALRKIRDFLKKNYYSKLLLFVWAGFILYFTF